MWQVARISQDRGRVRPVVTRLEPGPGGAGLAGIGPGGSQPRVDALRTNAAMPSASATRLASPT